MAAPVPPPEVTLAEDTPLREVRRRLESLLGVPATEGNRVRVLHNGDEIFPAMLAAIRGAERSVDLLTFVYWKGEVAREIARALAERARGGVAVRLLLDAVGARLIEGDLLAELADAGVAVEWFRKPWTVGPFKQNHRTHRKVLVVDGTVAFTGGVGIADEWAGDARDSTEWRDTHVQFEGPAVDGLVAAFAQNWADGDLPLCAVGAEFPAQQHHDAADGGGSIVQVARGSAGIGWSDMATVWRVIIESASTHLRIATAYFQPDDCFQQLLIDAVERGVEVDVLVPGPHIDKRVSLVAGQARYQELLKAGVRIWQFQPSMLHCKITTADGLVSLVGSANLNRRSLRHDEEVVATVLDRRVANELEQHFDADLERSERILAERWTRRPLRYRAAEAAARGLRHWL